MEIDVISPMKPAHIGAEFLNRGKPDRPDNRVQPLGDRIQSPPAPIIVDLLRADPEYLVNRIVTSQTGMWTSGDGDVNRFATSASMTCPCVNTDRSSTGHSPSITSRIFSRKLNPATTGNAPNSFCTDGNPNCARCLTVAQAPTNHAYDQPAAPKPAHNQPPAEHGARRPCQVR
jgi:hypothetical protein